MARPFLGGGFSQSRRAAQGCARQARGVRILTHPGLPRLPAWQDSSPRGFSRRPAGSACAASADTPFLRPRSESPCRELPAGCASLHQAAPRCTKVHQGSSCGFRSADGPGSLPEGRKASAFCHGSPRGRAGDVACGASQANREMAAAAKTKVRKALAELSPLPCRMQLGELAWHERTMGRLASGLAKHLDSPRNRLAVRRTFRWRTRTQPGQCRQPAKPMPCAAGETPALGLRARRD